VWYLIEGTVNQGAIYEKFTYLFKDFYVDLCVFRMYDDLWKYSLKNVIGLRLE
jgi:tricorn protease-like protein